MKTNAKLLLLLVIGLMPLLTAGCLVVDEGHRHHREVIVAPAPIVPVPVLVPVPR